MSDPTISVPSGLTVEGLLGRRYLARIIDSFVLMLVVGLAAVALQSVASTSSVEAALLVPALLFCAWIGYGAVLESSRWQATIGKRVVGLRVYNPSSGRITLMQGFVRALVKDGPFILLAFIWGGQVLSLIWLGAHILVVHRSPVNQAIHDRVAGTWVAAPEGTIQLRLT